MYECKVNVPLFKILFVLATTDQTGQHSKPDVKNTRLTPGFWQPKIFVWATFQQNKQQYGKFIRQSTFITYLLQEQQT